MPRRDDDFYETPAWMTKALLHYVPLHRGFNRPRRNTYLVEPCVGSGAIVDTIENELQSGVLGNWWANDIVERHILLDSDISADNPELYASVFANSKYGPEGPDCWVVSNPPYTMPLCSRIVSNAIKHMSNVAMLLRLSFLEPTRDREELLTTFPPDKLIVLPRGSFTGDGRSDSSTVAWMIWSKDPLIHSVNPAPIVVAPKSMRED